MNVILGVKYLHSLLKYPKITDTGEDKTNINILNEP